MTGKVVQGRVAVNVLGAEGGGGVAEQMQEEGRLRRVVR